MPIRNVGVASPGDMGQAVAVRLKERGLNVYTALDGRSARTRALAREAGLTDCGSTRELVATCDMVLSILNPGEAIAKAREIAAAMKAAARAVVVVDCNAIAPQTAQEIDRIVRDAEGRFIDAGIVGPPPRGKGTTRFYLSGPDAHCLAELAPPGIEMRVVSERIGDASAVKMCYGAFTKGTVALAVELLVAARRLGVHEALDRELGESLEGLRDWVLNRLSSMPPKAYRWVPEMLEIAKTFEGVALTPRIAQGAADLYEFVGQTPLASESPEEARRRNRDGAAVVDALAAAGAQLGATLPRVE